MPVTTGTSSPRSPGAGLACGLGAYLLWGIIPLYFKLLNHVAPTLTAWLTLGHRIVWSVVVLSLLLWLQGRVHELRPLLTQRRTLALLAGSTVMIAINWLVFIWAVAQHRVMEASLGYFINPLVNVALGMIFLGERLRRLQLIALAIAGAGVTMLAVHRGHLPWISLALAFSFGFYGLLRKLAPVEPVVGLLVETIFLLPLGVIVVVNSLMIDGTPTGVPIYTLLVALGITSSIPLLLFVIAARALKLSTLGFLQYLAPTCQFLLAVIAFSEPFGQAEVITFGCIWTALAIYSVDSYRAFQRRDPRRFETNTANNDASGRTASTPPEPLMDL